MKSLELVAERVGDPTALVYSRVFAKHPAMKLLFILDTDDGAKGHMLAEFIECLLDLLGERSYATGLLQTEMINHEGMGVPRDVFQTFFEIVKDTFRDVLAEEWTSEIDTAWAGLATEIDEMLDTRAMA